MTMNKMIDDNDDDDDDDDDDNDDDDDDDDYLFVCVGRSFSSIFHQCFLVS